METINQLLEVQPPDISEFVLIEFLNGLTVPEQDQVSRPPKEILIP